MTLFLQLANLKDVQYEDASDTVDTEGYSMGIAHDRETPAAIPHASAHSIGTNVEKIAGGPWQR